MTFKKSNGQNTAQDTSNVSDTSLRIALSFSLPPRGLNREAAARYIGISPSKFDQLVEDERMPQPKKIDARRIWDRLSLDRAFDALPGDGDTNPWDNLQCLT